MRVTEKGQVTIPKTIRDRLGIGPGSEVDFVDKGTGVELVRADVGLDRDERLRWIAYHLDQMRGTLDTGGLDGKAYVDMLRGPREDLDPD